MKLCTFGIALALCGAVACERRPKRILRTEPWAAPAVSSTASSSDSRLVPYDIEESRVRIDLAGKKTKPQASVAAVNGRIELDPIRLERSRATLVVDLLSLSVSTAGEEEPGLTARALDWLELGVTRPQPERERDRFARLDITGFEPLPAGEPLVRRGRVTAHGMLTLHHFRVPVELALEVDLGPEDSDRVTIRTQRPFVVSLAAHDILPRDERGELVANGISELGSAVGREARISGEISARRAVSARPGSSNP